MTNSFRKLGAGLFVLAMCGLPLPAASAVITTFSTRANFDAAVGLATVNDMNALVVGTSFIGTPLDLGNFSLLRTGTSSNGSIADGGNSFSVNGSIFGRVDTGSTIGDLIFSFDAPIGAFALDTFAFNDTVMRTSLEADGANVPVDIFINGTAQFIGFMSDMTFTEVRFIGGIGDSWGFDNITYSEKVGTVPLPATWPLFLLALSALGFLNWRRRKALAAESQGGCGERVLHIEARQYTPT